jgi:large subunit ribosomal protein L12
MEYIYAALLLDAAGKEVNEENIKSVIKAAGISPDEAMAKSVVSSLKGVNIKEVIKNAQIVQAAPAAAAAAPAAKEEKHKKEDEKKSEEEAASGLASLFG